MTIQNPIPYASMTHMGIDFGVYATDFENTKVDSLLQLAEALRERGRTQLAAQATAKAMYILSTIIMLDAEAEETAAYAAAEAEAHGIGTADDDTPLHNLALAFMATRTDLALMSLDEWLDEHHAKLSAKERAVGRAIVDLFFA